MKEVKKKERDIEKEILAYLKARGVPCWKIKVQGTYDPIKRVRRAHTASAGVSDILGVLPDGTFLAIEVKTPTGVVSEKQLTFLNSVNHSNGLGLIARSVDDVKFFI